jgi:hypothetical protein
MSTLESRFAALLVAVTTAISEIQAHASLLTTSDEPTVSMAAKAIEAQVTALQGAVDAAQELPEEHPE